MSKYLNTKNVSFLLWLALWAATLNHAGLAVWAMLSTSSLPAGAQIPPNWVALLGQGPTAWSFWIYIVVLAVNCLWESWFRIPDSYHPSTFPFPDFQYSDIALGLWFVLLMFAHLGKAQEWFPVPGSVTVTFWACFLVWMAQHLIIEVCHDPEKFFKKDPMKEPKKKRR